VILFRGLVSVLSLSSLVLGVLDSVRFKIKKIMRNLLIFFQSSDDTGNLITFGINLLSRFFMPSYFGNEIELDSGELLNDIYGFKWIDASVKERKNFIFIQENLKKNYGLVAAKMLPINLNTFLRIIQSAYSFYAVLKQIKH
jgi:hypothetical protein